ncbi:hypothetical protein F0231_20905, partial [Vibrio sp. RE86]|uniref:VCBS domain-containing protein n=1 Tax=Vibrio sp. RE86 TaxID=2607605 RepID=UPI001698C050
IEAGIDKDGNAIGNQTAGGTLKVIDPDAGQDKFQDVTADQLEGKFGTFSFNSETGEWTYELDEDKADKLDVGDVRTETLVVTSADGRDSHKIKVEVKGSNDAPTVEGSLTKTTHENASQKTLNLLKGADDVDASAELSIADLGTLPDGLSIADDGHTIIIEPSEFNHLGEGDSEKIVLEYNVVDGEGGITPQTAVITINGNNDDPTLETPESDKRFDDGDIVTFSVAGNFADEDAGTQLTFSADGLPAGLTISADGTISGTIDTSASQGGTNGQYEVTVTATDGEGTPATDTFIITVGNPGPDFINETSGQDDDTYVIDEMFE